MYIYNMFKCALHDTYNYTLNILRVHRRHVPPSRDLCPPPPPPHPSSRVSSHLEFRKNTSPFEAAGYKMFKY